MNTLGRPTVIWFLVPLISVIGDRHIDTASAVRRREHQAR